MPAHGRRVDDLLRWRPALIATGLLVAALVLADILWLLARPLALLFLAAVLAQALAPSVFDAVVVIFMSLYWLLAAPAMRRLAVGSFPSRRRAQVEAILDEVGNTMGGFVRSVAIDGVIIGVLAFLGLMIIGVDYPVVLAVIAGIGEMIPVVGPLLVTVPVVAVAWLDSPEKALVALIFWIGLQQLETHVIAPNVIRSQTDIPPLLVVFAAVAGAAVGGFLGALAAVPLAGALRVLALRALASIGRVERAS